MLSSSDDKYGTESGAMQWLRAGWLIDGLGGPPRRNVWIGIHGKSIACVGTEQPTAGSGIDFSHATVLPALIDAHVHLVFSGTLDARFRTEQLQQTSEQAWVAIRRHLREHLACGVAAVRDGGDRRGDVRRFKQEQLSGTGLPIHVAAASLAWHAAGRYGGMIGEPPPPGIPISQTVKAYVAAGDHLKVIQSGINSLDRFGRQTPPQFDLQELDAMIRAAHDVGRRVMVHVNGERPVEMALKAGCDSIEHGYFMGAENLRRMADQGTVWVPTAVPMAALTEAPDLSPAQRGVALRTLEAQLEQIRIARTMGVVIALGTDAGSQGVNHGHAVRRELGLLMSAGLSVGQAVGSATSHSARLLGLEDRGELIPGRRADLIAVPGPPESLPESLANIEAILIEGSRRKPAWREKRKE
jgi:imidazolonepropionase-like amidohydrolase